MLSPRLMLIPTCTMVDTMVMDSATMVVLDTMAMDWDTMARGPLMLMPSPLLILTSMVDTMAMVWAMVMVAMDMAVDTTGDILTPTRRPGHTSRSFSESPAAMSAKNGLFQFEFHPPPVLPVSVLPA